MTPEEAARDIVKSMECEIGMPYLLATKIRKAIVAAVLDERKACAKIADRRRETETELRAESERQEKQLSGVGHTFGATVAEEIARDIRARSNGGKNDG